MAAAEEEEGGGLNVAIGVVKTLAIVIGGFLTVITLMSLIGVVVESIWVRGIVALVVAIGVPLFLADRLLPDDDVTKGRGLPTDVVALTWMSVALLYVGLGGAVTAPLLVAEGDRLRHDGLPTVAAIVYWLAGVRVIEPETAGAGGTGAAGARGDAGPGGRRDGGPARATKRRDGGVARGGRDGGPGPAADAGGGRSSREMTPAEIFRERAPCVVAINDVAGSGGGTGFIIDARGIIATNQHVIARANGVRVKLFDGTVVEHVDLLLANEQEDLALLEIRTSVPLRVAPLGDSDGVTVGERVVSIGNPLGLEHTLTDGVVSARRVYDSRPMIQTSAPVSPGNSGGPLFDMRGDVIGVTTSQVLGGWERAQNLNLARPVNVLKTLIRADYPDRRPFGRPGGSSGRW